MSMTTVFLSVGIRDAHQLNVKKTQKIIWVGIWCICMCFCMCTWVYAHVCVWFTHSVLNELSESHSPIFFSSAIIKTALPNMDREAKEEYLVVIQAKDMGGHSGGLSGTTTLTVTLTDVNDNPPKFAQSKWVSMLREHLSIMFSFASIFYFSVIWKTDSNQCVPVMCKVE